MAIFRKIHVTFWSDSYTSELKEKEKLFYIYLLTNDRTTQLGCYEITKKQMSFDLGYSIDTVSILLKKFEKDGKIRYNSDTCEVALRNWNKYNKNESSKVQSLVNKEIACIKDKSLIQYLYCIDTVSILNPQEEEEQEEAIEQEEAKKKFIPPLLSEVEDYFKEKGFSVELAKRAFEFYSVNDWKDSKGNKVKNWKQKMLSVWLKEENNPKNNNTPEKKIDRFTHNQSVLERSLIELNNIDEHEANR